MQKTKRSSAPGHAVFQRVESKSINIRYTAPDTDPSDDILASLNLRMDALPLPTGVNESDLCELLTDLENGVDPGTQVGQLLTARLLEAALICAGHNTDQCEFRAAGDLLVNPRRIWVHVKNHPEPILKQRHTPLSRQFSDWIGDNRPAALWFKHNTLIEIDKPALLPYLSQRLVQWGSFAPGYLDNVQKRMNQIADAIGFLSAWSVGDATVLYGRIQNASEDQRRYINEHLCRFNTRRFVLLGRDIDRLRIQTEYQSPFLNQIPVCSKKSMN